MNHKKGTLAFIDSRDREDILITVLKPQASSKPEAWPFGSIKDVFYSPSWTIMDNTEMKHSMFPSKLKVAKVCEHGPKGVVY